MFVAPLTRAFYKRLETCIQGYHGGMSRTIWEECLNQLRFWYLQEKKEKGPDVAPGADGQVLYMLARARPEKVRGECLRIAQDLAPHHQHLQAMPS